MDIDITNTIFFFSDPILTSKIDLRHDKSDTIIDETTKLLKTDNILCDNTIDLSMTTAYNHSRIRRHTQFRYRHPIETFMNCLFCFTLDSYCCTNY